MWKRTKSRREKIWNALTSITDDGNRLRWTNLCPRKGGQRICIAGNPVQYRDPEYHQRGIETTYK